MCEVGYDYETPKLWSESNVRARKGHRCDACGGAIQPGSMYLRHYSVTDGVGISEKCCAPCADARETFAVAHGSIGTPVRFAAELRECFGQEGREFWTDEDRKWRSLLAGMCLRGRAARREHA